MKATTFQETVCANRRCSTVEYERYLFWQCLYRHAIPLALLLRMLAPSFFRDDVRLIQWIASDIDLTEIDDDLDRFEYGNRMRRHWLRTGLRIRMSSARVTALAERFFRQ